MTPPTQHAQQANPPVAAFSESLPANQGDGDDESLLQIASIDLERFRVEEHALSKILRISLSQMAMEDYLDHVMDVLLGSVPWLELLPGGGIFIADENGDLNLVAQQHLNPALHTRCALIKPGQCLCGMAALTRETQHADCVDERHSVSFPTMGPHGHYNIPILRGGILVGVLVLYLPHGRARDERDIAFLQRVVDVLAMGIHTRQIVQRQMDQLTNFDGLTGLPNRDQMERRLGEDLFARHENSPCGALLTMDIDRFAVINRSLGPAAGDTILRQVADQLRSFTTAGVTDAHLLARTAGGEFAIWLPTVSANENYASAIVKKLADALVKHIGKLRSPVDGQEISISVGIALVTEIAIDPAQLIKHAGIAMHHAKTGDSATVAFYAEDIQREAEARFRTERDLRKAINNNELVIYYQPQTDARGTLLGSEALIRWIHPQRGMISPGEFIPVAEESELIVDIGNWALQEVCRQLVEWDAANIALAPVSVNVSAREFQRQEFARNVEQTIISSGIRPELITLELTESMVMADAERVIERMHALREIGVRIALDDFGTGYSSLTYLKDFPLHEMKIDQSFVRGLPEDEADVAIVESITTLAHRLGFEIVAEGVETEAQRDFLAALNCTRHQGYLFDRPMPAADFTANWLLKQA